MDEPARTDAAVGATGAPSAGALLRAARERQGMHIATLAAAIKVAPRKLEALENDRWDELPGPTFTRALAQAVCRALKADPQSVMELLPPADTSMLDSSFGTINEPFSGRPGADGGWLGLLPRGPGLVAAVALLVAAAVLVWLPTGFWARLGGGNGASSAAVGESTVTIGAAAAVAPAGTASVAGPATSSTLSGPATPGAGEGGISPASLAVPVAPPAGALVIACSSRSWIEVIDARGRVLVSRNLEAGEALGVDGLFPLQVAVGNVAGTQVTYKGASVDLAPRSRDNVAKFELK